MCKSMIFQSSILTGCRAKLFMKSNNIVSRMIAAVSAASGMAKIAAVGRIPAAGRIVAVKIAGGAVGYAASDDRWKGEDDAVVWRSHDCTVHWVVKSEMGEYWGDVEEDGIGVGDVLAYCGSTV